jgi:glucose/mannose-6-phosphate isomerase
VLDDLKYIHQRDKSDALGIASKQKEQMLRDFGFNWSPTNEIKEVIFAGMGGSGLAGKAYKQVVDSYVPFEVLQDYNLPDRVDVNTLVICSSYSGNTEETLSILDQILNNENLQSKPMVVVISSGGQLIEMAKQNNLPFLTLPTGFQPRFTFWYQYRALAEIFANTPIKDGVLEAIKHVAEKVDEHISLWLPERPTSQNLAKQIALELVGKSPVIYSSVNLSSASYKWKISINENAKNVAWYNQFPEFNHNEFLGWTGQPLEKPYAPVFLQSSLDHPQITKRFEVTKKLLSGRMPEPIIVPIVGESALEQLAWTVILGDFVSLYLALLNNIDPTPVDIIEKFKTELKN